jgi:hypothetical protein
MSVSPDRRRQMGMQFRRDTERTTGELRVNLRDSIESLQEVGLAESGESSWEVADNMYTYAERWVESMEHRLHEYTRGDQQYFNTEMLWFLRRRLAFDLSEWLCPHRFDPISQPPCPIEPTTPVPTSPECAQPTPAASPEWRRSSVGPMTRARRAAKR